jgi:adenine phosphoribosyltransferase
MPHPPINCEPLKSLIRTIPDFPKPGILFYDITTLLKDKKGYATLVDALAAHYIGVEDVDLVLGIEARGFIFGPALAYRLNAGFVPVRKPDKLPGETARVTYDLEYGTDALEIHLDAIEPGQNVLIVDDLLATGGTMEATVKLVRRLGARIVGLAFAIELDFLNGRDRFKEYEQDMQGKCGDVEEQEAANPKQDENDRQREPHFRCTLRRVSHPTEPAASRQRKKLSCVSGHNIAAC